MTPAPDTLGHDALRDRSLHLRWACLLGALAWAAVAIGVIYGVHISQGHWSVWKSICDPQCTNYYVHPPALTLFAQDPSAFVVVTGLMCAAIVAGATDLIVRSRKGVTGRGMIATAAGTLTVLYSLFGLLLGLASVGVVGALIVLSGLPVKSAIIEPEP